MVETLVAFDAMAEATRSIPELQLTSAKFAPPKVIKDHLAYPGMICDRYLTDIWVISVTNLSTETRKGICKLKNLLTKKNRLATHDSSMKYLHVSISIVYLSDINCILV